jgi:hypothetical protein
MVLFGCIAIHTAYHPIVPVLQGLLLTILNGLVTLVMVCPVQARDSHPTRHLLYQACFVFVTGKDKKILNGKLKVQS